MTLLDAYNIDVKGKKVAILGRSNIVGKPMALMMINAGATVLSCNSHTQNLAEITRMADVVIVAIGKPKFLTREMVSSQAIIVDVGSNMENSAVMRILKIWKIGCTLFLRPLAVLDQ